MVNNLCIEAIEAFDDKYIWLLTREGSNACAVVDPGDEEPVIEVLQSRGLTLKSILITHKHYDHIGGVSGLKQLWPQVIVFGPGNEGIKVIDVVVDDGDAVAIPALSANFEVLSVPGHTEGHVAYFDGDHLFCGDTLFAGGCGRVFSGTFAQMTQSLKRIRQLPAATRVYCAHEYTQANLGFGLWVEPDSKALQNRRQQVDQLRQAGKFSVPSLLSEELMTNPFLRVDQPEVAAAASRWAGRDLPDEEAVFTALRQWKDRDYD